MVLFKENLSLACDTTRRFVARPRARLAQQHCVLRFWKEHKQSTLLAFFGYQYQRILLFSARTHCTHLCRIPCTHSATH